MHETRLLLGCRTATWRTLLTVQGRNAVVVGVATSAFDNVVRKEITSVCGHRTCVNVSQLALHEGLAHLRRRSANLCKMNVPFVGEFCLLEDAFFS
jgi:hypothetical protein